MASITDRVLLVLGRKKLDPVYGMYIRACRCCGHVRVRGPHGLLLRFRLQRGVLRQPSAVCLTHGAFGCPAGVLGNQSDLSNNAP